jgi:hypothetical protein
LSQKFTLILTEFLVNADDEASAAAATEADFYHYVVGRFRYVFLRHVDAMWPFAGDLDLELFSAPTIDPRIRAVFEEFRALRS